MNFEERAFTMDSEIPDVNAGKAISFIRYIPLLLIISSWQSPESHIYFSIHFIVS